MFNGGSRMIGFVNLVDQGAVALREIDLVDRGRYTVGVAIVLEGVGLVDGGSVAIIVLRCWCFGIVSSRVVLGDVGGVGIVILLSWGFDVLCVIL